MRFDFDPAKSLLLRSNSKRGIGFEEAQALFEREHMLIDAQTIRNSSVLSVGFTERCTA